MATSSYSLPLCDDEYIQPATHQGDWYECRCGIYYNVNTIGEYNRALDALAEADSLAAQIEEQAELQDAYHRTSLGGAQAAVAAASALSSTPAYSDTQAVKPATNWVQEEAAKVRQDANKAPVRVKAARPNRVLPKLSPQQTLLTVAATLIVIALSIFFGSTWNELNLGLKALILVVIVAATAFGSIKSKKYFVIISNFLAALSSAFLALGLSAAGILGLLNPWIPDVMNPQTSFYPTFILLATGGYSLVMGRRFKVFGWLAFAPVMLALAGLVFSVATLSGPLGVDQHFIGYKLTALSLSMLLVIAVGRLTRLPQEVAAVTKKSKKQPELSEEAESEQKYQQELHVREQNALVATYRLGVWATAGVGALLFIQSLIPQFVMGSLQFPDATSFAVLGAFWFAVSVFIQNRGAAYTVAGEVSSRIKLTSWILGFAPLALGVGILFVKFDRDANQYATWLPVIGSALVGAAMLFVIGNKLSEKFDQARRASVIGATVVWAFYALLAPWSNMFSNLAALWLAIVAAALFVKSWQSGLKVLAYASAVVASLAAIMPSLVSDLVAPTATSILLQASISAVGLALTYLAVSKLNEKLTLSHLFVGAFYLVANVVVLVVAASRWFSVARIDMDASQPAILMALAAVIAAVTALGALTKLAGKSSVQAALLAAVSLVWAVAGFVLLAPMAVSFGALRADLATLLSIYSVVIFSISTYFASRSKLAVASTFAMVFGTVMAVTLGRSSFDLTGSLGIVSPLLFLGTTLTVAVLIKKFASKVTPLSLIVAIGSFAISWLAYMPLKTMALYDGVLANLAENTAGQLTNSTAAMVVYLAFAVVLLLARLRKQFAADAFYSRYLLATGLMSLLGALLAASSVMGAPASLWLIAITLISSTALAYLTAGKEKSRVWLYATYALALSSVVAIQCAVIPAASISASAVWLNVLIPANMILVLVVHLALGRLAKRVDVSFGWNILPISTVAASGLAFVSPIFTSFYAADSASAASVSDTGWTAVLSYSLVGVIYLGWRLTAKVSQEFSRALLSSSLVALVFAIVSIFGMGDVDHPSQLATLFAGFAGMLLLQAFAKREVRTNFYGSTLLVISTWLFVWANVPAALSEYFSLPAVGIFVLSTRMLRRADKSFELRDWWFALPALYAIGTVIGVAGNFDSLGKILWIEFALATAIGAAATFISARASIRPQSTLRLSVFIVACISWILGLRMATTFDPTGDDTTLLRQMIFAVVVAASILIYSQLLKSRGFFFAGYALATIAGASVGAYAVSMVIYDGSELFWTPVAVGFLVAALLGSKQGFLPERVKSLLVAGVPLLAIILSSTAVSWMTVTAPVTSLDGLQLTRLLALAIGGAVLLTLGLRIGNLGVTVAGGTALGLTLVPNVWFRIEDAFSGRSAIEMKALFVGVLAYMTIRAIVAIAKLELRSIVWVGVPVAIAMVPSVLNLLSALPQQSLTSEDWIRFGIVLGGSTLMLVLGALRRLGGLFVPGAIGVVVSALPYAWKQITAQSWGLWLILILVAALLVFVAIRLEQFRKGTKNASSWLKELR